MTNNYVIYHLHDDKGSLLDSCTKWEEYVDRASDCGMKAIASTNHGYNLNWTDKKLYAESKGLKYINGIEAYLTPQLYHTKINKNGKSEQYKVRDNFHTILLAKNRYGVEELNNAINKSYDSDHKYYKPRITFDEFFNLSNDIIKISACLASPLRCYNDKCVDYDSEVYKRLLKFYDYYEVQYWNSQDQIEYNQYLYKMSKEYNKPLIMATDTHSINSYKAECRKILMISKGIEFTNEDEFDLTFKTYDELVNALEKQQSLPREVYMEAIENTNRMAETIQDFKLNTKSRYPILTGSRESDAQEYIKHTKSMFKDKVDKGIIPFNEVESFKKDLKEELSVFKKTDMLGFMLSMSELMCWCKSHGIPIGPSRGSVAGSRCAFVTDIIDVDPVRWNTVFSRFCNENRVESGD